MVNDPFEFEIMTQQIKVRNFLWHHFLLISLLMKLLKFVLMSCLNLK